MGLESPSHQKVYGPSKETRREKRTKKLGVKESQKHCETTEVCLKKKGSKGSRITLGTTCTSNKFDPENSSNYRSRPLKPQTSPFTIMDGVEFRDSKMISPDVPFISGIPDSPK